ncbi:MAG: ABC transporter permease, partial [Ginsengibacter sp.]
KSFNHKILIQTMLKNNFKIAWRNLMKNKTFAFINIAGLSIGMAACLLILQYVSFQLSYDQFNKNADDIYRVVNDRFQNGKLIQHGTITYSAIGKALQDDYPEVTDHSRVMPFGKTIISYNNKRIGEEDVIAVDNSFMNMFSYPMIAGDRKTALQQPYTVILSESSARKIFNVSDNNFTPVIGRALTMQTDSMPYKVTGVCKDVPKNSHLSFDILASYTTILSGPRPYTQADYDFTDSDFWHYIQLKHGTDHKALEAKLSAFSKRHFNGNKVSGSDEKFYLQPLSRAHLYSDFEYEIGNIASATVVWGLLIIAALIIIIAWVNYINLATAKSLERAKEVGIRKVSGATRPQLIRQFLTESLILNIAALLIAVLIVILAQKSFNGLIQHQLSLSNLLEKGLIGNKITAALLALIVAGILISGFYPAFVLSSFSPILVLKGKYTTSGKGIVLRKALVVGQFAVTVALIIGSFVVYRQIKFVNEKSLGMDISQMLIVKPPQLTSYDSTFITRENSFTAELKNISNVLGASASNKVPGNELSRGFNVHLTTDSSNNHYTVRHMGAGEGFIELYGIKIKAGRSFLSTDYNPDFKKLHNIILTESAVKLLGLSSDQASLGKSVTLFGNNWDVVGVINDFHQKSLRYPLEPTFLVPTYSTYNPISIKVSTRNLASTMASIRKKYDAFFPGNIFDYYFLNDKFNEQYSDDQLFGKVFSIFACFAIFIASLGLLGLSLFATMQRTKEIGVRKVLGATIPNIVALLSKDFIRLVVIAFVIASPVAWFVMHSWLQNFAYRINISWWIFFAAGLLSVLIALATISLQAIKAAMANPIKSLRTE